MNQEASRAVDQITPQNRAFFDGPSAQRNSFAVSSRSSWGDVRWYLPATRAGQSANQCYYNWGGLKSSLDLIEDCRMFVWSVHHENLRGRAAKSSGAVDRSYAVRRFLRWMEYAGVHTLGELPTGFGFHYLSYLLAQDGASRLKDSTVGRLLDVPVHIFDQAQVMRSAGRDYVRVHPFNGQNPYVLARSHAEESGTIPPVPDELFIAVAAECCVWIEKNCLDIIPMIDRSAEILMARGNRNYDHWRSYAINKAMAGLKFDATGMEWRGPLGEYASRELGDLVRDLRAACVIAVQAFTGMRISEVLSLQAEPRNPDTGWPACICIKLSRNGLMELFYLRAKMYKGQSDYVEVEWIAGARPVGSEYIPPPVRAILVLERALRRWRSTAQISDLILSLPSGGRGLPTGRPLQAASYVVAASDQIRFVTRYVYEKNPEAAARLEWWRISTHQWRKSFAQFIVRSDERLLRAVSEHFKHVSLAMTSEGYVGNDLELLGLIDDEALSRVAEVTMRAISGEAPVAGPLADLIDRQRAAILKEVGNGMVEDQIVALKDVLREDNVRSWSCGWGDCFFRPETARCHSEVLGTYSLNATKPHAETRRPDVCCECANLIVLAEHRPFWESRLKKNQLVVEGDPDKKSTSVRIAGLRIEQAERILRRLDRALVRIDEKKTTA